VAESGVAAHCCTGGRRSLSELQSRTHQWLQSLIEIQKQTGDSTEFLENIKVDLFRKRSTCSQPKADRSLPRRATPVDFAYASTPTSATDAWRALNGEIQRCGPSCERRRGGDRHRTRGVRTRRGSASCAPARRAPRCVTPAHHQAAGVGRAGARLSRGRAQLSLAPQDVTASDGRRWRARPMHAIATSCWPTSDSQAPAAVVARQIALLAAREAPPRGEPARPARSLPPRRWSCAAPRDGAADRELLQPDSAIDRRPHGATGLVVHQLECRHAQRARRAIGALDRPAMAEDLAGMYDVNLECGRQRTRRAGPAAARLPSRVNILNCTSRTKAQRTGSISRSGPGRRHLARVVRSIRHIKQVQRVSA